MTGPERAAAPAATGAATMRPSRNRESRSTTRACELEVVAEIYRQRLDLDGVIQALAQIHARQECDRCKTPPPPAARWPGDRWARDTRPDCMCGRLR